MYFSGFSVLYVGMTSGSTARPGTAQPRPNGTIVARVLSPEDLADATMRRLRAEIVDKFGTVKNFARELTGIGYEGLNDNLAGRSDMRLSVLYECLAVLGMDQSEFTRRIVADAESRSAE